MKAMADVDIALLLYGNGAGLGDFRFFADDLAAELVSTKKFGKPDIIIKMVLDRKSFFDELTAVPSGNKIKELHVFSHSIGAGLYVGYKHPVASANRVNAIRMFPSPYLGPATRRITYDQVLATETGGILTDHLVTDPLKSAQTSLRSKFASGALMKLWGCNSGVSDWVYSDEDSRDRSVVDQDAPAKFYYWRALNTNNVPKPSISQAFADYFGVKVLGTGSGSNIEVKYKGRWIDASKYKKVTGRFAGEPETLRLHPSKGDFISFSPAVP